MLICMVVCTEISIFIVQNADKVRLILQDDFINLKIYVEVKAGFANDTDRVLTLLPIPVHR